MGGPELPENIDEAREVLSEYDAFVPRPELPASPDAHQSYVRQLHLAYARTVRRFEHSKRVLTGERSSESGPDLPETLEEAEAVLEGQPVFQPAAELSEDTGQSGEYIEQLHIRLAQTVRALNHNRAVSHRRRATDDPDAGTVATLPEWSPESDGLERFTLGSATDDDSQTMRSDGSGADTGATSPDGTTGDDEDGGPTRRQVLLGGSVAAASTAVVGGGIVTFLLGDDGDGTTDGNSSDTGTGTSGRTGSDNQRAGSSGGNGQSTDETPQQQNTTEGNDSTDDDDDLLNERDDDTDGNNDGTDDTDGNDDGSDDTDGNNDGTDDTDGNNDGSDDTDGNNDGTDDTDGDDNADDQRGGGEGGEFALVNVKADAEPNNEYVELRYTGTGEQNISGYILYDKGRARPDKKGALDPFAFPEGTVLSPGATVRVYTGDGAGSDGVFYWGYQVSIWNQGGDTVFLQDTTGSVVFETTYGSSG
jgi:hypothetical protein